MGELVRILSKLAFESKPFLAIFGIFINLFHLSVLSRKSMCSNSVNVLMIGIGLCDMLNVSFFIYDKFVPEQTPASDCTSQNSSTSAALIGVAIYTAREILRRLSSWLDVLLAFVRLLIIKNSLNPKFKMISKPQFGILVMTLAVLVSVTISMLYWTQVSYTESTPWTPGSKCQEDPKPQVQGKKQYLATQILYVVDGFLRIVPSAILPLLAFLLIRELRTAKLATRRMSFTKTKEENTDHDHTTKIVILMTIFCMTAEVPLGIVYIGQGIDTSTEFQTLATSLISIFGIFVALNAISHCFICYGVSSQYRKSARELFSRVHTHRKSSIQVINIQNKNSF